MEVKEITVSQLKEWRDEGKDFQLIDVRETFETEICEIGGELIPLNTVLTEAEKISKEKDVVIHCRSGARSAQAVMMLQAQFGYEKLYNLKGGILAWANEIDQEMEQY